MGARARLAAVPPRGTRRPAAGRDLLPRIGLRPRSRRRRLLARARGQLPHPVGDLLRAREQARDDPARPGAVHRLPGASRRRLPAAAAERPARGRAGAGTRPDRRRVDARAGEQRLLRALVPRPPDGGRAGRSGRPRRPRRHRLHADHRGPGAGGRDLPAPRRRLHRPARVPTRLAARRSRPDPRLPRRDGGARERGRHRRRRRQGRLRLRPGDGPLLPRRGAAARERAHLPAARSRAARVCARPTRHPGGQADGRVGWQGRLHRPARHRRGDRPPAPADRRRPGPLDRPGGGLALDDPDRHAPGRARPAPRRPAAVRRLRIRAADRPGRPHSRCPGRGRDDRQLVARRRLEGHLGALGGRARARGAERRRRARVARDARDPPRDLDRSGAQQQQQQARG